ncbi:MAG: hypothetical protein ACO2PL_15070 [Armatimonadota bacterium]
MAKAIEAVALYQKVIGTALTGSRLAKAIGVPLRTPWRLLKQVWQTVPYIKERKRRWSGMRTRVPTTFSRRKRWGAKVWQLTRAVLRVAKPWALSLKTPR